MSTPVTLNHQKICPVGHKQKFGRKDSVTLIKNKIQKSKIYVSSTVYLMQSYFKKHSSLSHLMLKQVSSDLKILNCPFLYCLFNYNILIEYLFHPDIAFQVLSWFLQYLVYQNTARRKICIFFVKWGSLFQHAKFYAEFNNTITKAF